MTGDTTESSTSGEKNEPTDTEKYETNTVLSFLPRSSFSIPSLGAPRPSLTFYTLVLFPKTEERKLCARWSLIFGWIFAAIF